MRKIFSLLLVLLLLTMVGCSPKETETSASLANPALSKCIEDGYIAKPLKENGIVTSYLCVNAENGKKCKAWDYFRKSCSLK